MMLLQSFRLAITPQQADLDTIEQWRGQLLSSILYFVTLLGFVVAIPSVIFASNQGLWSVALVDTVALAWIVTVTSRRSLSFNVRAWNFCALLYVLGVFFMFTVGMVSQIYLMGFSVMVVLLFGVRPAMFALALNAVTLVGIGYLADADLNVAGFEAQPLLKWIVITINFMFINASITLSTGVLLNGLQKSLERKRESEVLYRTAFVTSPDAVNITRLSDGLFLEVNDGFLKMLGWTRDELQGRTSLEINAWHNPQDRQGLVEALRRDGHYENLEAQFVAKSGRVITGLMSAHVMEIRGEPCILSVMRDITERKAAEDQLRKLSQAIEQSSDNVVITNVDAKIEYVNAAFVRNTGYSREDAMGKNPRFLQSGKTPQETYTALWEAMGQGRPWSGEFYNQRKDGSQYIEWAVISPIHQPDGSVTHYLAVNTDITTKKAAEERINHLAFFDPLTELPNRRLLLDRLKQATAASARSGRTGALLFIDLDNFKTLNDTLGHDIGDLLLQQTALRLVDCVREGDTVSRLGGDEFVLLLESLGENAQDAATGAETVGKKIIVTINQPYQLAGFTCHSSPSIGVTLFADHQGSLEDLLKRADLAMYKAKEAGRNTLRFFEPEMQTAVTTRAALESDLREAVQSDQFLLHYQAQVDRAGGITGVEALLRWQHPQRGLVSPLTFISLAEDTGLIVPIGLWVLETACSQLSAWSRRPEMRHLSIAVNVSARQFYQQDFVEKVLEILEKTGANPQRLKLELTESLLVSNIEDVIAKMLTLKAVGVGFSLDDFGTGYSSLSYLKRLPLDQLKIDQGFVRDILTDPNDAAIAKMVIVLAESLGLVVIAEGVETVPQRDFLAVQGCHAYQGYLFSKPIPIGEFEEFAARV